MEAKDAPTIARCASRLVRHGRTVREQIAVALVRIIFLTSLDSRAPALAKCRVARRARLVRTDGFDRPVRASDGMRPETDLVRAFKLMTPVQFCREKYLSFAISEFVIVCRRPVSIRGTLRGRHGR